MTEQTSCWSVLSVNAITRETGAGKTSVWNWPKRFLEAGIAGLSKDKSRKPGKAPLSATVKARVVEMAATQRPENATHGNLRLLAKAIGISLRSAGRILAVELKDGAAKSFRGAVEAA
jgi:transposase